MTDVLDPLAAADRIAGDYVRYLRSAFSPRDPGLRADFDGQLADGRQLTRGPILQAMAPYATRSSLGQLIDEGLLSERMRALGDTGFGLDRPLYVHQEEAIRKAAAGRNLIVATGTGSGKTESFLLPIIDELVREIDAGTIGQPGVRALLLYPMNALANDQIGRLRDLLVRFPEIRFGRYVGDTEHTYQRGLDQFRKRFKTDPAVNEMICRDDMKVSPPHILVTNFAMLEYLLLRPDDQQFFDGHTGEHWRTIVLDEVHVYDGAKGAEIGMLLRRVRDRVVRSEKGRIRCVGTSATLGKGREDIPQLLHFATQLFDERFEFADDDPDRQDIVEAVRDELVQGDATWFCPEDRWVELRDQFRAGATAAALAELLATSGASAPEGDESSRSWLGRVLSAESHVVSLQHLLGGGSVDITKAAKQVMAGPDGERRLAALVDVCVGAEVSGTGRPLIPARWHFLVRALEGAYTCLAPDHPADEPQVLLSRHAACPACRRKGRDSAMFETAVCRRCGAKYLVGEEESHADGLHLGFPRPVAENPRTFLVAEHAATVTEDEDEAATDDEIGDGRFDPAVICVTCGSFGRKGTNCSCGTATVQLKEVHPVEPGKPIRLCAACGGRTSGASIVQRFLTGSDAPVAVIATSLYQELPAVERIKGAVGDGRKLLSFADSRQDAAFFAPYLERTYNRAMQRRLLWQVLSELAEDGEDAPTMRDLRTELKNRAIDAGIIDEFDEQSPPDQQVRHWLYAEILSTDRQQNLEGVGLAELAVPIPRGLAAPQPLLDLGLSEDEVFDLMRVLLDSVRRGRAVTVDSKVDLADPIFESRPTAGLRGDQSERGVLSWNPSRGTNQRVTYVQKVLDRLGRDDVDAKELVAQIWEQWLAQPGGDWDDVLVAEESKGKGILRKLKAERLEFRPVDKRHRPLQCDSCRQVWWRTVRGACPGVNCPGTVTELEGDVGRDHYRELYTSLSPIGLRVEEHTAQLSTDTAAERQQEFIDGKINALSCSTTFELGVDVGEIQAVLMRNVPPSAANYVQRAGRAGRRAGSPALVVTFAQRRSHDLHFFDHPHSMVDGHVAAPVVKVDNPAIVRRHLNAMAFAQFQKAEVVGDSQMNTKVDEFFLPAGSSPADRLVAWLREQPTGFGEAVARVVPDGLADHPDIGVATWGWLDGLDGDPKIPGRARMVIAGREVRTELTSLDEQIEAAYEERKGGKAAALERVRKTVASVRTIDRLARAGVLPKYGFPVDVVTLDLRGESSVELDRDLSQAVADFAPGNEIVADKRVWSSAGLKVESGLTLLIHRWAECGSCHAHFTWLDELEDRPNCPSCDAEAPEHGKRLIQPRFGFVGADTGRRPGDTRPPRTAFTTAFFDDYENGEPERRDEKVGTMTVEVASSRSGRITVVNQGPGGRGYQICHWCGFIRPFASTPLENHHRPGGTKDCTGRLTTANLGHWYLTDTLQVSPGLRMSDDAARSALQALLAATEDVGVSQADMNGSITPRGVNIWSFVLFDSVPGGAGHADRIAKVIPQLFKAARYRVEHCDCGEETSCYGCLRSYRNQMDHDRLQRRLALEVFDQMGVS